MNISNHKSRLTILVLALLIATVHLYEGRWLKAPNYMDDYSIFWFRKGGEPRRYSFWAANAIWAPVPLVSITSARSVFRSEMRGPP